MSKQDRVSRPPSCLFLGILLLLGVVSLLCLSLRLYRPDRPAPAISPASSTGPAFVVQVIRPRAGLPLGGLLPPQYFGVDAHLGFDSDSEDANIDYVDDGKIELSSNEWDVTLVFDSNGDVHPDSEAVFEILFEDRLRRVRCRPDDPGIGTIKTHLNQESGELSGSFDIELKSCDDANTGKPLGWPPSPFILHGSFDRLKKDSLSD